MLRCGGGVHYKYNLHWKYYCNLIEVCVDKGWDCRLEWFSSNCHFGWCVGLLRGDPVSSRDWRPGTAGPAYPTVGSEGHLPAGLCTQRPGSDEGQVRPSGPAKQDSFQDCVGFGGISEHAGFSFFSNRMHILQTNDQLKGKPWTTQCICLQTGGPYDTIMQLIFYCDIYGNAKPCIWINKARGKDLCFERGFITCAQA